MNNNILITFWVSIIAAIIVLSKGMHHHDPLVTLKNIKMFTQDKIINSTSHTNVYYIPPYFSELQFECNSSYPTKWEFSTNPYEDGNLKEIPKVIKTRLPVNDEIDNCKKGPYIYSSTVILKFKKTDSIPNMTCEGVGNFTTLNSSVLISEPTYKTAGHFTLTIKNGTGQSVVSMDRMRFGRNTNCILSLHISTFQKKYACRMAMNATAVRHRPIQSRIIECCNPDECRSIYRDSHCDKEKEVLKMEDPCSENQADCVAFIPFFKPGVIVCDDGISDLAIRYQLGRTEKELVLDLKQNTEKGSELLSMTGNGSMEVYAGKSYIFVCNASMYSFALGIQWFLDKINDSFPNPITIRNIQGSTEVRNELTQFYTSSANVTFNKSESESQLLSCAAPIWNSEKAVHKAVKITVKDSYAPANMSIYLNETTRKLVCKVSAQPMANITWKLIFKDGNRSSNNILVNKVSDGQMTSESEWFIGDLTSSNAIFRCKATNFKGETFMNFTPTKSNTLQIILFVSIAVIAVFILALSTFIYIKSRQQQRLSEADIAEFEKGTSDGSNNNPILLPYNDVKFEIPKESLTMDGGILGSGYFGIVVKGRYKTTAVAIKSVKRSADIIHFKALLSELKIMCHIGGHPHLVNLIGACTKNIRKQELYIVVEYCCNGNLMKLLRKYRSSFVDHYTPGNIRESTVLYVNADSKKLSTKDLVRWSSEIASGMEFLCSHNVIHGDLAARNVLISENMTAKLCDFGLSKQLYDYTVYVQKPQKPLPLKWMALESLRDLEFSIESDIWSYGITIWEMFSLGQSPYPGLEWNYTSWNLLEGGYRMTKPEFCNDTVYKLMLQCWDKSPKFRLPFGHLRIAFENELNRVHTNTALRNEK